MTSPHIVNGKERRIRERDPPPKERRTMHKWLNAKARQEYQEQEEKGFSVYLSKLAEEKIRNHALSKANERLEIMGLLLGSVCRYNGGTEYALVRDIATTDLDASSVRVRFSRNGLEKLFLSLEESGFDYVIVGWYHSHPGHRCFMSPTDVDTQRAMFNQSYHTAIVVDPINQEIDAFYLEKDRIRSRPFAVYWDEYQNPYFGESVKRRRIAGLEDMEIGNGHASGNGYSNGDGHNGK